MESKNISTFLFFGFGVIILLFASGCPKKPQEKSIVLRSGQGELFANDPITTVRILEPGPPSSFFPAVIVPESSLDSHPETDSSKAVSTDQDNRPGMNVCEAEFKVPFSLPNKFQNASLSLFVGADDSGIIFLNDNQIGTDPLGGQVVQIVSENVDFFKTGENTLTFKIRNELNGNCPNFDLVLIYKANVQYETSH